MTVPPGLIVDTAETGDAIEATLRLWLPTYLAHLGRLDVERRGDAGLQPDQIALPASYRRSTGPLEESGDLWPERLIPAIYVIYEGIIDDPTHDGDGKYRCRYRYTVSAVVAASDREATVRLSQLYTAAIVGAIVQHPSLGGHASGVKWRGGDAGVRIAAGQGRHLAGGSAIFDIQVDDVIDIFDGLDEPMPGSPPDEAPDRGTFKSYDIDVRKGDE